MPEENSTYRVFALKWRPETFEDVVGQEPVKRELQNAIRNGRVGHAYLFAGPRGVGKTSIARIFAKALNCETGITPTPCNVCHQCISITRCNSMDVIEIDGASYNKVENIHDLQEGLNRATFSARKKVYIIDEVHMLSTSAFNALLKTLEEPPGFVVFIFATTEIEKIPETIRSRCQVFLFERISSRDIMDRLDYILKREKGIDVPEGERQAILQAVAASAEGGLRDAEVALDQLITLSGGHITFEHVSQLLGLVELDILQETVRNLAAKEIRPLLERVAMLVEKGRDLERFIKSLQSFVRDLMILKAGGGPPRMEYSPERIAGLNDLLREVSLPFLLNAMNNLLGLEERMKSTSQGRFLLEFTFIKLCVIQSDVDIDSLLKRAETLGRGAPASQSPSPGRPPQAPPSPGYERPSSSFAADGTRPPVPPAMMAEESLEPAPSHSNHQELWDNFKSHVSRRKRLLEDCLKRSHMIDLESGTLNILSEDAYDYKMMTTPDSVKVMEKILSWLLGHTAKVNVRHSHSADTRGGEGPVPREGPGSEHAPAPPRAQPVAAADTPLQAPIAPVVPDFEEAEPESFQEENGNGDDDPGNSLPPPPVPLYPEGFDPDAYIRNTRNHTVPSEEVKEVLKKNPDADDAIKRIKKVFGASLTHMDGKKIT